MGTASGGIGRAPSCGPPSKVERELSMTPMTMERATMMMESSSGLRRFFLVTERSEAWPSSNFGIGQRVHFRVNITASGITARAEYA